MSLINTVIDDLRVIYPNNHDRNEDRPSRYAALDAFQRDTASSLSILSADALAKIAISIGNNVDIPVIDSNPGTVISTRTCTVPVAQNTSQLVTLAFTTVGFNVSQYAAEFTNNTITKAADLQRKMEQGAIAVADQLDTLSVAQLETDKTVIFGSDLIGPLLKYQVVGDAIQVTQADKDLILNDIPVILEGDDFGTSGRMKIIANTSYRSDVRRIANQGAGNDTNLGFQVGDQEFFYTNRIVNGANVESTFFAVQEGTLGFSSRIDRDARLGHVSRDGTEWSSVFMPISNIVMGVKHTSTCANGVADTGQADVTATLLETWQFTADVTFVTAYNSDPVTRAQPIYKVEILL